MNLELRDACQELLQHCDDLFTPWYERIHGAGSVHTLTRMQSFVTRYRARPNENALLRHIDGALVCWLGGEAEPECFLSRWTAQLS